MSSILDALRKLEATTSAPTRARLPVPPPPRRGPWLGLVVGLAVAAGVAIALWAWSRPETRLAQVEAPRPETPPPTIVDPPPPPPVEPARIATAAVAAPPLTPAADALPPARPTPPLVSGAEPPLGRVALAAPPELQPPVAPREPQTRIAPPAPVVPPPEPEELAAVEPEPPPPPARAPAEDVAPTPPGDEAVLARRPPGAPIVQVSFLVYSRVQERRRVALVIDGGNMVVLHEGEAAGDLEVARILPDRIDVRYRGQEYAVRARD